MIDNKNKTIMPRVPSIDHADADKDWGHGITVEMLQPYCRGVMSNMTEIIWKYCNIYKINPALVVAISAQETGWGTSNAIRNKNNPGGIMDPATNWSSTKHFSSLQEGFRAMISNLSRNYMAKGLNTIQKIGNVYCPVGAANDDGSNQHWVGAISSLFKQITGRDFATGDAGTGVKNEQLDPVENGLNGAITGDGTGGSSNSNHNFDNREDWENLTNIKGIILGYMYPQHAYSVKNHRKFWEKDKYTREFHFGVDSSGIYALKEDSLIAQSMQDNNKSTYINRALFENKAIKYCISVGVFTSIGLTDYTVTEKNLIRYLARLLHKYKLETKDLWREFDLNRAASPVIYLDRVKWKAFLREVDKQLVYLQTNYPQDDYVVYNSYIGSKCRLVSDAASVLELPEQGATEVTSIKKKDEKEYVIKSYSNTWFELEEPAGWIEVKHVEVIKDYMETRDKDDEETEEDIEENDGNLYIDFPEIDESKMPEVQNVLTHEEFMFLLSYSSPTNVDNYAGMHEPYDKNLPEIINSKITDDDRMSSMTTTIESLEENKLYFSIVEASSGDGDHCKKASAELNGIWKTEDLKVEPIYPDLIIPPKYTTADQNVSDPNALPPSVLSGDSSISDYLKESSDDKDAAMCKIAMFDYNKVKREKATKGKPINYTDPYPYDDKINELEQHHPKVKIDEIESRLYDCNHIGCPIGQPMAKNFHMLNNALISQSKRTEKRLVKLENTLAFVMRNLGRLGSRMHINCVYYGGQDTFGKYKTIRCLKDDRLEDGCSMTIDQCMSCTRYEPILGQIYEIMDATGMNGAFITDDEQMSYNNAIDFNKLDNVSTEKFADLTDDTGSEQYKSLLESWKEVDRQEFEAQLKEKYKGEELDKKLKAVKEHDYLFKMDWDESLLETQEPDVKVYPLEGIKAKYKVKAAGDAGESKDEVEQVTAKSRSGVISSDYGPAYAAARMARAVTSATNGVFIGDSWGKNLVNYVKRDGGECYHHGGEGAASFLGEVKAMKSNPSFVYIYLGLNDLWDLSNLNSPNWEKTKQFYQEVKDKYQPKYKDKGQKDVPVYVGKVIPIADGYKNGTNKFNEKMKVYNDEIAKLCKQHGFIHIDVSKGLVGTDGKLKKELVTEDCFHLKNYSAYYNNIKQAIMTGGASSGGTTTTPTTTDTDNTSNSTAGTPIIGTTGGNVTVGAITGVTVIGPEVNPNETGDNDVNWDNENWNKLNAGEWVDTREIADTHEIHKYTSEEFFFEGFGTDASNGGHNPNTNILGQGATEIRNKICEMALKIVDDHVTRKKAWYSRDTDKRTTTYVADQEGNTDKDYYYDCSSFVSCCYRYAGLSDFTDQATEGLLAQARKQDAMMWVADEAGQEQALPGDIILFGKGEDKDFVPCHAVVWLDKNSWAHASTNESPHPNQIRNDKYDMSTYKDGYTRYFCRSAELAKKDEEAGKTAASGQFDWPVPESKRMTSPFGKRNISYGSTNHKGIDIGADPQGQIGNSVVASDAGTVIYAAATGNSYGTLVKIDHGNGYETRYAHLNSLSVTTGDSVTKGQKIGMMGKTGGNYAVHLHFEIRKEGTPKNPEEFLTHVDYKRV